MRSFLIPDSYSGGKQLILTGREYHYIVHVLRLKEDDTFRGQDSEGNPFSLRITAVKNHALYLEVTPDGAVRQGDILPDITLYQCICKGKKMDRIIRQAAEAGVTTIVPLFSRYTVPRRDEKEGKTKLNRWNRVIKEALQQSGSRIITKIREPIPLKDLTENVKKSEIKLFFHQSPLENRSLHEYLCEYPEKVSLLVGPEGGLSREETGFLMEIGFKPVLLKTNILRAETAALYAIGAVQCIVTEKTNWQLITQ